MMKRAIVLAGAAAAALTYLLRQNRKQAAGQSAQDTASQVPEPAQSSGTHQADYAGSPSDVKVAVIYYSSTGHNYELARAAAEAAAQEGAQVRLRKVPETAPQEVIDTQEAWKAHQLATAYVPEVTLDDLEWADAYLFSVPTRYGGAASQMRIFMDTTGGLWFQGKLANKVASVMTSAQNVHGGVETTLKTMYVSLMHWGCVLVPPGYTDQSVFAAGGNPYGTSAVAAGQVSGEALNAARHQARRVVTFTRPIRNGLTG